MINEIKEVVQLGGTVTTVVIFIFYLIKRDAGFDKIINNHLNHSGKIIKANSRALTKVAVNLEKLSIIIKNGKIK